MNIKANETQVGGAHYRKNPSFQHWDLMAQLDAGYFPGQVTKYAERHPDKNGKQDLEKCLHFAVKMHEIESERRRTGGSRLFRTVEHELLVMKYCVQQGLSPEQTLIFQTALLRPDSTDVLVETVKSYLESYYSTAARGLRPVPGEVRVVKEAVVRPGTPEDGGHHAGTQEELGFDEERLMDDFERSIQKSLESPGAATTEAIRRAR